MSEMVDRVAATISKEQGILFESLPEMYREIWRTKASAAIGAMREPTDAMIEAGWCEECSAKLVWQDMINEALR
jgi:hypothetical protein